MRLARYIFAVLAVAALVACGKAVADPAPRTAPADPTAEAQHYREVRDYTNAVRLNETIAWNGAVWANGLLALERDYVPPPPPPQPPAPRPVSGPLVAVSPPRPAPPRPVSGPPVGGSCGGATNGADAFIQRESGGNPNARNASGARGCYQLMPEHFGAKGACANLTPGVDDAACASRLPLSAWSSSGPTG